MKDWIESIVEYAEIKKQSLDVVVRYLRMKRVNVDINFLKKRSHVQNTKRDGNL